MNRTYVNEELERTARRIKEILDCAMLKSSATGEVGYLLLLFDTDTGVPLFQVTSARSGEEEEILCQTLRHAVRANILRVHSDRAPKE